jgi:hypothetical protein
VSKEALLVRENKERHQAQERDRCQIGHVPGKPPSSSCAEPAKEMVDGLVLCERHALEVKLEGQIECWGEMLFHIDLWSREARRRKRPDVVGLFDGERAKATVALERAHKDLDVLRRRDTPWGAWGKAEVVKRSPLKSGSLLLPPRDARPRSLGLRRLRRR